MKTINVQNKVIYWSILNVFFPLSILGKALGANCFASSDPFTQKLWNTSPREREGNKKNRI